MGYSDLGVLLGPRTRRRRWTNPPVPGRTHGEGQPPTLSDSRIFSSLPDRIGPGEGHCTPGRAGKRGATGRLSLKVCP